MSIHPRRRRHLLAIPGQAAADPLPEHRPLDDPQPGQEAWWCQTCGGPCRQGEGSAPEIFPSEGPPAELEAGNLPVLGGGLVPVVGEAAVDAAIRWDRAAAAEPYQVDLTRTFDDTVRMGNHLSAAVRLELLGADWRDQVRDALTDPVSGAELDAVDGLPLPVEDVEEEAPRRYALPRPTEDVEDVEEEAAPSLLRPEGWVDEAVAHAQAVDAFQAAKVAVDPRRARVLNWTSRHDERSLAYGLRPRLPGPAPLMDRLWEHGPILDQGESPPLSLHDASGCTGHAGVNAANIIQLATAGAYHRPDPDELYGHGDAMRLYERAQELDDVPGQAYPGTSVLALMKAGQEFGFWGSYLWAFGTRDVAQAILQAGPVIVGIPWLADMGSPGPDGIVTVGGADLGGHCLCLFGLRMKVGGKAGPWFGALQTWGESVGDHGVIWIHHKDLAQLLHSEGEAAIPQPTTGGAL